MFKISSEVKCMLSLTQQKPVLWTKLIYFVYRPIAVCTCQNYHYNQEPDKHERFGGCLFAQV